MIEKELTKRLKTLETLQEAVVAMKSLAAHHFLKARKALQATRSYRETIDQIVAAFGIPAEHSRRSGPRGIILIGSDLGLCGDYNSRLVESLIAQLASVPDWRIYVVGKRGQQALKKHGLSRVQFYPGPVSVEGIPGKLLTIAEDVIQDYSDLKISSLDIWSAQFQGAGNFDVRWTRLLPLTMERKTSSEKPSQNFSVPYQSPLEFWKTALREYLYVTMYQLLLDALASEHGMRLVAAENARKWIGDSRDSIQRKRSAIRRELSTQEVLDIVSASRSQGRSHPI